MLVCVCGHSTSQSIRQSASKVCAGSVFSPHPTTPSPPHQVHSLPTPPGTLPPHPPTRYTPSPLHQVHSLPPTRYSNSLPPHSTHQVHSLPPTRYSNSPVIHDLPSVKHSFVAVDFELLRQTYLEIDHKKVVQYRTAGYRTGAGEGDLTWPELRGHLVVARQPWHPSGWVYNAQGTVLYTVPAL